VTAEVTVPRISRTIDSDELRGLKSCWPTQERGPNPARQLDDGEPFSGVQVVLPAVIDNAQVAMRIGISEDPIDLVKFQRCRVRGVVEADGKLQP
jgi:hypothetical protein